MKVFGGNVGVGGLQFMQGWDIRWDIDHGLWWKVWSFITSNVFLDDFKMALMMDYGGNKGSYNDHI